MTETPTIAAQAADTKVLISKLQQAKPGDIIDYSTLSDAIGSDVTKESRTKLYSAMRSLLRDDGIVFSAVRKVGVKRLLPEEHEQVGPHYRRKIARASRLAVAKMSCADTDQLSNDQKVTLWSEMSFAGAISTAAKPKHVAAISVAVKKAGGVLPLAVNRTLDIFKS